MVTLMALSIIYELSSLFYLNEIYDSYKNNEFKFSTTLFLISTILGLPYIIVTIWMILSSVTIINMSGIVILGISMLQPFLSYKLAFSNKKKIFFIVHIVDTLICMILLSVSIYAKIVLV